MSMNLNGNTKGGAGAPQAIGRVLATLQQLARHDSRPLLHSSRPLPQACARAGGGGGVLDEWVGLRYKIR